MPECYVPKREHQLECDKPLHREGWRGLKWQFVVTYFLNDPYNTKTNNIDTSTKLQLFTTYSLT